MRPRTIILGLAGVLLVNALIVLGVWLWFNRDSTSTLVVTPAVNSPSTEDVAPLPVQSPQIAPSPVSPSLPAPEQGAAWVELVSPLEGESVPRRFAVTGRCGALPERSRLMFVIDSGRGVYSPKFPLPTVEGGNFSGAANDFGAPTGGSISLCVFAVTEEGLRQLAEWQAQGKATGKYPPFRQGVPGGVELKRIKLRIASR